MADWYAPQAPVENIAQRHQRERKEAHARHSDENEKMAQRHAAEVVKDWPAGISLENRDAWAQYHADRDAFIDRRTQYGFSSAENPSDVVPGKNRTQKDLNATESEQSLRSIQGGFNVKSYYGAHPEQTVPDTEDQSQGRPLLTKT